MSLLKVIEKFFDKLFLTMQNSEFLSFIRKWQMCISKKFTGRRYQIYTSAVSNEYPWGDIWLFEISLDGKLSRLRNILRKILKKRINW